MTRPETHISVRKKLKLRLVKKKMGPLRFKTGIRHKSVVEN